MNQFKIIIIIIIFIIYTTFLIYYSREIDRNKKYKEKLDVCYRNRDTFYKISRQYYVRGSNLNYDESNLITIQDKINYLTIHEFPDYKSKIVDKIRLHEYSKKVLGKDICVPILKVYKNSNDIVLDELPNEFVLKCNHGSQMNIICKDKNNFNLTQAKLLLN